MRTAIHTKSTATVHSGGPRWASRLGTLAWAAFLLLAVWAPPLASQEPVLTEISVAPVMNANPITVNGVTYNDVALVLVDPDAPLAVSGVPVFYNIYGYRFVLQSIVVQRLIEGKYVDEVYATNTLVLPNTHKVKYIRLVAEMQPPVVVNISGPGTVVWDPPAPPDGFVQFDSTITFTPVPGPNAYFAGWDAPWDYDEGRITLFKIQAPQHLTAYFRSRTSPPATLSTDGAFPELRMRTSDYRFDGQVRVLSSSPIRIRYVIPTCEPGIPIIKTAISSHDTPFVLQAALGPENNSVPDGLYSCALQVLRHDGPPPFSIPFQVRIGEREAETPPLVSVNGASFVKMPLAPGSIFSLFGEDIGLATAYAETLPLPQSLGGIRVRIRSGSGDYYAPIFYASKGQVNFLAPPNLPTGDSKLEILRESMDNVSIPTAVEWQAPGLFAANSAGSGPPAGYYMRVRGDEQERGELVNCPEGQGCVSIPIESSDPSEDIFLVLFGTGFRNAPNVKPQVHMGDMVVEADYFGAHREFAGLDQINVKVPRALLGKGAQPVFVTHGGKQSNTLTIEF